MGNYNIPEDYDGFPIPHAIVCRSGWEGCHGEHEKAWQVKECYEAKAAGHHVCGWGIQIYTEDGPATGFCERPAWTLPGDDNSFECAGGHSHISQETRIREGWDYAGDQGEAELLARAGVEPRTMAEGKIWPA